MTKETCLKCGSNFDSIQNECTPATCFHDVNIILKKCDCDICECKIMSPKSICSQCRKGYHRTELKR